MLLTLLLLVSCLDKSYKINKSIHITCKGDTIVTYGGTLYHYDSELYKLDEAE